MSKKKKESVFFSSETDLWETPKDFFDVLDREFKFTLDVCANADNAKCEQFFTKEDDALVKDWGQGICWMNPPYGKAISDFMRKAYKASRKGAWVVCLVPARMDTNWWFNWVVGKATECRIVKGRLRFGNAKNVAPFVSAVVIYNPLKKPTPESPGVVWWKWKDEKKQIDEKLDDYAKQYEIVLF